MKQEPMGNVHVCSGFAWWFPFANTNQRWREIPWKSYISCFATNHDVKPLMHVYSQYTCQYRIELSLGFLRSLQSLCSPHIPPGEFIDKMTHGGHARVSANVLAEGCGPSARHAGPGELWGWIPERNMFCAYIHMVVIYIFEKHTNIYIYIERNTPWHGNIMVTPGGVFKCWM